MKWRQTDSKMDDPIKRIASRSRAQEEKKVVGTLLGQVHNEKLTVLPIVGMGGLGKTTLAQLVYNDSRIKEHFRLLLWVCVSDNFDFDLVAKNIIEAAVGFVTHGKPPLDNLRDVVTGKRYLLVLDDVWNRDASKWEKLRSCLQHGGTGSSVVTTTRDEAIARLMGTVEAYKLDLLENRYIEEIIKTKAFSSEDESPADERVEMVGDMAMRCAGSPLAATALGSLLCTKPSVAEWKAVLSRSTICDEETGILPILRLSYNDLPSQMRQCFSFCAMFPKDYEIGVEMLIQLWMANGFILEEKGVSPEIRGKQIFNELASRSFFQDLKETPSLVDFGENCYDYESYLMNSKFRYCSGVTCKIHGLMHDVAQSAMGRECATIAVKPSKSEDFPYSTRHLFVTRDDLGMTLNGYLGERSPALQTLLCTTGCNYEELRYLSKYNSIRALRMQGHSPLKPKYLHHLRYLDLSGNSSIMALPEDIGILYHLQTLNVSGCRFLSQLPKGMKYMTALHHFYIDHCPMLKKMPPKLRCLASLQTLTCFVAGTGSSCSKVEELGLLDLGGYLEVRQLENVTERHAKKANLENKKKLTGLRFEWTHPSRETQGHHLKVLEVLKPHEGIKALRIHGYSGHNYPSWMETLQHLVELVLSGCNLEKLPPQLQLRNLQVLYMAEIENLKCLCGGDPTFTFINLKELCLYKMPNLETSWDVQEVQGILKVEKLSIRDCRKLTALPRASVIEGDNTGWWRSAFLTLEKLLLWDLASFQRWETGAVGGQKPTFPQLKMLSIRRCPQLTTPPEAQKLSVLKIGEGGHDLLLPQSNALMPWNCFEKLENLEILKCGALVQWPENVFQCLVSLRKLVISDCKKLRGHPQASEQSTPERNIFPSCLESLILFGCDSLVKVPVLPASLRELRIEECEKLEFMVLLKEQIETSASESPSEAAPSMLSSNDGLPPCQVTDLEIWFCMNLRSLSVQLDCTKLSIRECTMLKSLDDLPSLESLGIYNCKKLDYIPDVPEAYTSLRYLAIRGCPRLKVLPPCLKQQLDCIDDTSDLDACYIGPNHSRPSSWTYAITRHC